MSPAPASATPQGPESPARGPANATPQGRESPARGPANATPQGRESPARGPANATPQGRESPARGPANATPRDSEARWAWLEAAGLVASFGVPFVMAALRAQAAPSWAWDARLARGLGGAVALQGAVSDAWMQWWMAMPFGSLVLRATWASSVALGVLGCMVFTVARHLTKEFAHARRTSLLLAMLAAWAATVSSTSLAEGTAVGGGTVAAVLAMALLVACERAARAVECGGASTGSVGSGIGVGLLAGALFAESAWTAGATVTAVLLGRAVFARAPSHRQDRRLAGREAALRSWPFPLGAHPDAHAAAAVAVGVLASLVLALLLRAVMTSSTLGVLASMRDAWSALGSAHEALASAAVPARTDAALARFARELGTLPLALAIVGAGVALLRRASRATGVALVALVALECVVARLSWHTLGTADRAGMRLLAMASLAIGSTCSLAQLGDLVAGMRARASRSALVFLVMFDLALVVSSAEEASFVPATGGGAERFVQEAFDRLPPSAVVLVQSRALLDRLKAARIASGARPDVAIVPYPHLTTASAALVLLGQHPVLTDVLRDFAIEDRPLERSLSALADKRPLFVEFDASWDRRIVSHLLPDHLWFRFHPEPRGAVERRASFLTELARIESIVESLRGERDEFEEGDGGDTGSGPDDNATEGTRSGGAGEGKAAPRDGQDARVPRPGDGGRAAVRRNDSEVAVGGRRKSDGASAKETEAKRKGDEPRAGNGDRNRKPDRVVRAAIDRETMGVLVQVMRSYAIVSRDLGDRDTLFEVGERVSRIAPGDPLLGELWRKADPHPR